MLSCEMNFRKFSRTFFYDDVICSNDSYNMSHIYDQTYLIQSIPDNFLNPNLLISNQNLRKNLNQKY